MNRKRGGAMGIQWVRRRWRDHPFSRTLGLILILPASVLPASSATAWTTPVNVTDLHPQREVGPRIAADGLGDLHLVWFGGDDPGSNWRIYHQTWTSGSWSAPLAAPISGPGAGSPDIAVDGNNNLHVVFDRNQEIFYSRRVAGSWSPPLNLTNNPNKSIIPKLAVDTTGNHILVVWHEQGHVGGDYDIITRKYTSGTWEPPVNISSDPTNSNEPRVVLDSNGNFHVIWQDAQNRTVHYRQRSPDGTWGPRFTLDPDPARSGVGDIAVTPGNVVHVVFSDETTGYWDVYHTWFNGTSWSAPLNISNRAATDVGPALAIDNYGRLSAVWHDHNNIFARQHDGTSWGPVMKLHGPVYLSNSPHVAIHADSAAHVVWQTRPTAPSDWDVFWSWKANPPPGPLGTMSGTVRDLFGVGVEGAAVTAGGNTALSGPAGQYELLVPPGTWTATASRLYFDSHTVTDVAITANTTTQVDFTLSAQPPGSLQAFNIEPSSTRNLLSWTNPTSGQFGGTVIRYKTTGYPGSPEDGLLVADDAAAPGSSRSFMHTGLTNGVTLYYAAFPCDNRTPRTCAAAVLAAATPAVAPDFDRDGDVDQEDFGHLQRCLVGPAIPPEPGCENADLDGDGDVDAADLEILFNCTSGPNVYAEPGCAD